MTFFNIYHGQKKSLITFQQNQDFNLEIIKKIS